MNANSTAHCFDKRARKEKPCAVPALLPQPRWGTIDYTTLVLSFRVDSTFKLRWGVLQVHRTPAAEKLHHATKQRTNVDSPVDC